MVKIISGMCKHGQSEGWNLINYIHRFQVVVVFIITFQLTIATNCDD